jgi:hypothetical protein
MRVLAQRARSARDRAPVTPRALLGGFEWSSRARRDRVDAPGPASALEID